MSIVASYGQQKNNVVKTIEDYRKEINEDTTVKWVAITKEQLKKLSFYTDAVTVFSLSDTVVKVSEWILHPPMKRLDYYFKGRDLILLSFSQENYCGSKDFFYNKKELVKVTLRDCDRYKSEDDKELANSRIIRAKEFLTFFVK
ncbi:hypothetical protein [Foetidibacter luteolus]|uniref:hypothetical protein n=1 Tax=Foetidibacter luteolus TaxID=2608880 RepID=UPI00129B20BF|nr:hypothetical protein [Foetidibacter luteolus]